MIRELQVDPISPPGGAHRLPAHADDREGEGPGADRAGGRRPTASRPRAACSTSCTARSRSSACRATSRRTSSSTSRALHVGQHAEASAAATARRGDAARRSRARCSSRVHGRLRGRGGGGRGPAGGRPRRARGHQAGQGRRGELGPGPARCRAVPRVTRAILGLGNPGEPYRATRHNVGFRVVEELARRRGVAGSTGRRVQRARSAAAGRGAGEPGHPRPLVQPQTYMNRSGYAARCLAERHGLAPADVLVVYDEVSLPLGRLRLRRGAAPPATAAWSRSSRTCAPTRCPACAWGSPRRTAAARARTSSTSYSAPFAPGRA